MSQPMPPDPSKKPFDTARPLSVVRDLRVAAAFLTRLPVAPEGAVEAGALGRAAWAFPAIGAGVGGMAALAYWGAAAIGLPPLPAAFVAVGIGVWLTGALHEDGLADVADAFGLVRDRDTTLRILRDSSIGTFGTLAIVLSVGLRVALVAALAAPAGAAMALIAAGTLSRAPLVAILASQRPARTDGMAATAGGGDTRRVSVAAILAVAIAAVTVGIGETVVATLAVIVAEAAVAAMAQRRLGGHTGDVLGAGQQAAEIAVLAVVVAAS